MQVLDFAPMNTGIHRATLVSAYQLVDVSVGLRKAWSAQGLVYLAVGWRSGWLA